MCCQQCDQLLGWQAEQKDLLHEQRTIELKLDKLLTAAQRNELEFTPREHNFVKQLTNRILIIDNCLDQVNLELKFWRSCHSHCTPVLTSKSVF